MTTAEHRDISFANRGLTKSRSIPFRVYASRPPPLRGTAHPSPTLLRVHPENFSRSGLQFIDIQQLNGLLASHPDLRPLEPLLLHWHRTQAPVPLSRAAFRNMLLDIGRPDLASLVPPDDERKSSGDAR